jgi:hypothetical protein
MISHWLPPYMNFPSPCVFAFAAALLLHVVSAGAPFCGICANGGPPPMANTALSLQCNGAAATLSITFASYGTPSDGSCGSFAVGACNAANSSAIVSAACDGRNACTVFPNTTTFGDPCFGTAKVLAVEATCSDGGSGTSSCSTPQPPPETPYNASVRVADWSAVRPSPLNIEPSVQVVSQHFLFRDSPIAAQSWATLSSLGARSVRFVPWIPYPSVGVGELDPPSVGVACTPASTALGGQSAPVALSCGPRGGVMSALAFGDLGQPTGTCNGGFAKGPCSAPAGVVAGVFATACAGKASCSLPTDPAAYGGSPCPAGAPTWLAVAATCSAPGAVVTYWNMSLVDAFISDFWAAVGGNATRPIINFSTQPTWLYSLTSYNYPQNADSPWYGYDRGSAPAPNGTALGDYYGRMISWFTRGSFVDEAGDTRVRDPSLPLLNITLVEVFNGELLRVEGARSPEGWLWRPQGIGG